MSNSKTKILALLSSLGGDECDMAQEAIRYFILGSDDQNAFARDNLYRLTYTDCRELAAEAYQHASRALLDAEYSLPHWDEDEFREFCESLEQELDQILGGKTV